MDGVNTLGKGRPSSGGTSLQQSCCRTWGAKRAGGEMQAEKGTVGAGLTCVGRSVTGDVGCDLALLTALIRPDSVVAARGTQDVVAAQRSPMCWTADGRGKGQCIAATERPAPGVGRGKGQFQRRHCGRERLRSLGNREVEVGGGTPGS